MRDNYNELTSNNDIYYENELYYNILNQDSIYINSVYLDKKWYRRIFGGKWRLIKLGRDTPCIGMFCVWTKLENHAYSGYIKVLDEEEYPITKIYKKQQYRKELFKYLFDIRRIWKRI